MLTKYRSFIAAGKLADAIRSLETSAEAPISPLEDENEASHNLYTLEDELQLLKFVSRYHGLDFHEKLPIPFWRTFKQVSGSTRSLSSLRHHWNGPMMRKYKPMMEAGTLGWFIKQIESALSGTSETPNPRAP
jgi:hypothetical protein